MNHLITAKMPAHSDTVPKSQSDLVAKIADREGLVGGGRDRFVFLLTGALDSGREVALRPQRMAVGLVCCSLLAVVGMYCFIYRNLPPLWAVLVLLVITMLGAWVAQRGVGPAQSDVKYETFQREWDAYCRTLRPLIIEMNPGLLDRNLPGSAPSLANEGIANTAELSEVEDIPKASILIPLLFGGLFLGTLAFAVCLQCEMVTSPMFVFVLVGPSIAAFLVWLFILWRDRAH